MTLLRLALRDLRRSPFRSIAVCGAAFVVAALGFATLLVATGASDSLELVSERLGADVIVMPSGTETGVEGALLMGTPSSGFLDAADLETIRGLPGVEAASAQLYLASLSNASCCSVSEMFLVAFDPASDFTVQPWIRSELGPAGLMPGEAVGGALVSVPEGESAITLYGYPVSLKANLAPTGTNLDRSLFITAETAQAMASRSATAAIRPLELPGSGVSAILVRVSDGSEPAGVASLIGSTLASATATPAPGMFSTARQHMASAFGALTGMLVVAAAFALLFIALVSAMASHELRRETGVLRALGATRSSVIGMRTLRSALLAVMGGAGGIAVAALLTLLFRDLLVERLGFPFLYPAPVPLLILAVAGLSALSVGVGVATAVPAALAAWAEPATAMRE